MRVLLDTHLFIWAIVADRRLSAARRRLIESADAVHVSSASIWEISIKATLGRIDLDPLEAAAAIADSGFVELPVRSAHAARVAQLPVLHKDPFDRLLIAQALCEPLILLTADATLPDYGGFVQRV